MRIQDSGTLNDEQPTWRLWGEERIEGAVYTVYLKKVRYHSPSKSITSESEQNDDGISHLEWETVRVRFVKAGSLEKLVESLAAPDTGELESTYINVFLATYRTFASAKQVLNLLIERYDSLSQPPSENDCEKDQKVLYNWPDEIRHQHCKTLRQALHVWLDQYPEDFREPPNFPCLSQLEAFVQRTMPDSELDMKLRRIAKLLRDPDPPSACHPHQVRGFEQSDCSATGLGPMSSPHGPPPLILKSASPMTHQNSFVMSNPIYNKEARNASSGSHQWTPYSNFLDIPEQIFAQQLTKMDCELFKRVIPHQCLGAVWSRRRDKNSRDKEAQTVVATVDQFNAVSYRVISTIVRGLPVEAKPAARAKIISKWIDIAQELRVLKNFSSLKAIISGLQSNPVYRLRRTWQAVPKDKLETFEELARIFSGENNALAQRELLVREGTARFADTVGEKDYHMQKVLQKHSENSRAISYGTIPYLGTFLTDLTMIDTAITDVLTDGLINFDKRRKEFEVLAQIKLLQGAANAYHIETLPRFNHWFESVEVLDERESFDISCEIEPNNSGSKSNHKLDLCKKKGSSASISTGNSHFYHKKNDSIASTISSSSSSQVFYETDTSPSALDEEDPSDQVALTPDDSGIECKTSQEESEELESRLVRGSSSTASQISIGGSIASSSNNAARSEPTTCQTPNETPALERTKARSVDHSSERYKKPEGKTLSSKASTASLSVFPSSTPTTTESPYKTSEFYIIRVQIEANGPETEGVIMYKSIMVGNHERTKEVIHNAMLKHGLGGSPENYSLSQLLPDRELLIPPTANVYYAINTQYDLNFVLREKPEDLNVSLASSSLSNTPHHGILGAGSLDLGGTPRGLRKPSRDNSKARRKILGLALWR